MSHTHFDDIAHVYDESLPAHVVEHYAGKRVAFLRSLVPSGKGLDVGCGTGVLAERLAAAGLEMTGCDPSAGMLAHVGEAVETVVASGTDLPFADGSFDLVYCVAVMHHVAEAGAVRATLGEMVRVCRPGGRVVIWDHNPRNPYWKLLMRRVPQDDGSERLIGEAEVRTGLEAGGGRVLSAAPLGLVPDFAPPATLRAFAALERRVERTPGLRVMCAHNVVVATPA